MKKLLVLGIFFILGIVSLSATADFFVKQGGTGDGSSWQHAAGDLMVVLGRAKAGQTVWVARGTYIPSPNDRNASFYIKSGVKVYGGFTGSETALHQRNPALNLTILSGEIGSSIKEDNSFTVVTFVRADKNTTLDGFKITGGYADGLSYDRIPITCGGAIFNDGTNGASSPQIINCNFQDNYARNGGAIYNRGTNGRCEPLISKCLFSENTAQFQGGAIYNDGQLGVCNPMVTECDFLKNKANYGAGILNQGSGGEAAPLVYHCDFVENFGMSDHNPVFDMRQGRGIAEAKMQNCKFERNSSRLNTGAPNSNMAKRGGAKLRSKNIAY